MVKFPECLLTNVSMHLPDLHSIHWLLEPLFQPRSSIWAQLFSGALNFWHYFFFPVLSPLDCFCPSSIYVCNWWSVSTLMSLSYVSINWRTRLSNFYLVQVLSELKSRSYHCIKQAVPFWFERFRFWHSGIQTRVLSATCQCSLFKLFFTNSSHKWLSVLYDCQQVSIHFIWNTNWQS